MLMGESWRNNDNINQDTIFVKTDFNTKYLSDIFQN